MKKNLLALFVTLGMLTNCSVIDELTKFDLDYQTNYSIASTTIVNTPLTFNTPDITTDSESSFENNNTHKDLVESIKLKRLKMTIETPETGDFNFIKDIYVYMDAEGLDEIEIANKTNIENTNTIVVELDILEQELKEYLKQDRFNLRVKTITDESIDQTHDIVIDTKFRIDAKILGV